MATAADTTTQPGGAPGAPAAGTQPAAPAPPAGTTTTAPAPGTTEQPAAAAPPTPITETPEYKKLQADLAAAQLKIKEREDAELTAQQRLERDLKEAQDKVAAGEQTARNLRAQVAATQLNIVDPAVAAQLLDWANIDDTDASLTAALTQLVKDKPYLVNGAAPALENTKGGAPARTGATTGNLPTFTKTQIADRTFWNANRDAILKAIADGRVLDE